MNGWTWPHTNQSIHNRSFVPAEPLPRALTSRALWGKSPSSASILHYAKWRYSQDGWIPFPPRPRRTDQMRSSPWPRGGWRCHGHSAVCLFSRLSSVEMGGCDGGLPAGSRCSLVGMNKRRAGSKINNECTELRLEAAERHVPVFNLLKFTAGRQDSGEHTLYFSLNQLFDFNTANKNQDTRRDVSAGRPVRFTEVLYLKQLYNTIFTTLYQIFMRLSHNRKLVWKDKLQKLYPLDQWCPKC